MPLYESEKTTDDEKKESFLNAQKTAQELADMYSEDPNMSSFNMLLLGEMGTGKTFVLRTARKPVHIDSFDPGGSKGLREYIKKGEILVDKRYEKEDPMSPQFFEEWLTVMQERIDNGYFNNIGTYCLDSATTWSKAVMNRVLQKAGRAGQAPRWAHDYVPQKTAIENAVWKCLNLPCDFILTGHLEHYEDKGPDGTFIKFRFMTTGKGAIVIPTLFDEVIVARSRETSQGNEYVLQTKGTDSIPARSRLAADGLLEMYEKPDIKNILMKAGMDYEDKPSLLSKGE